jgi:hypothetical protein
MVEAMLLAGGGYLLGLAVAWVAVGMVKRLAPPGVARLDEIALDPVVLVVSGTAAVLSGLLFGVLPALRAARSGANSSGAAFAARAARRDPVMAGLVTTQVAVSLVILAGAALTARSLGRLLMQDVGFETEGLWIATLRLPPREPYRQNLGLPVESTATETWVRRTDAYRTLPRRLTERLEADSRIAEVAAAVGQGPLNPAQPSSEPSFEAYATYVEPGFFEVLRIPLVDGRLFTAEDADPNATWIAVVNDALAERFWPGESAVGKRFGRSTPEFDEQGHFVFASPPVEIVGVTGRIQDKQFGAPRTPAVYLLRGQVEDTVPGGQWIPALSLFLRPSAGAESAVRDAVVDALKAVAPDVALNEVEPMSDRSETVIRSPRFYAAVLASFGVVGLVVGDKDVVVHQKALETTEGRLVAECPMWPSAIITAQEAD